MNRIRLLKAADYPRMPWKNGAGSTLEILRDAGDGLDGFGWRLSIADVGQSGPFSAFSGYQRVITVLEGAGMRLTVDGQPSRDLCPLDAFAFDGGAAVDCTLIDGPIRDFNLIYAPARYAARLQWLRLDGPQSLFSDADHLLLFAAEAGAGLQGGPLLERHDCLHLERSGSLSEVRLEGAGTLCLIELLAR
ncbi:HutD family protein [Pseudomonas otitidis]|uniref:HutD/Ves family protein n=1 Tax=Metapseudomonas otitidis TaxID=319939 RepID=UPI0024AD9D17|nr:HutD family protein [Pseudomonas otitidis]MDI6529285.1 HutD family protein [Pseudomonas otitidis]